MNVFLEHFLIPDANETNVYLIACLETRQAALIDAGGFDPRVVEAAREREFRVGVILITHDHYDHTGAIGEYVSSFPACEIVAGSSRAGGRTARAVRDGEIIAVGNLEARALSIPGHTSDSTAYHFTRRAGAATAGKAAPEISVVFSGDALFAGSVGGTSGEAAHEREKAGIREKLFVLPGATIIYPGHGPATTVDVEKRYNPFF